MMILSKFAEISLPILRGMESCLKKLEDRDGTPSFHQQWEEHIFREAAYGPKCDIPRGDYFNGSDVVTQDTYRTRDGMACFEFRFHRHGSTRCDAEIISVPTGNGALSNTEGTLIPSGSNPPVKTYSQAKKLAKVWAEYAWLHIREECPFYYENQAEQEESGEVSERYYNPDVHGRKVVRMK